MPEATAAAALVVSNTSFVQRLSPCVSLKPPTAQLQIGEVRKEDCVHPAFSFYLKLVSDRVPFIADLKPSGKYVMEDLHEARALAFALTLCSRSDDAALFTL
eukprot:6179817-Pleurochrysis_carterae.AAC.2